MPKRGASMGGDKFNHFVQWGFYSILTGCVILGTNILSEMKGSIEKLNEQVAIVLAKTQYIERDLQKHDLRLEWLEKRVR